LLKKNEKVEVFTNSQTIKNKSLRVNSRSIGIEFTASKITSLLLIIFLLFVFDLNMYLTRILIHAAKERERSDK